MDNSLENKSNESDYINAITKDKKVAKGKKKDDVPKAELKEEKKKDKKHEKGLIAAVVVLAVLLAVALPMAILFVIALCNGAFSGPSDSVAYVDTEGNDAADASEKNEAEVEKDDEAKIRNLLKRVKDEIGKDSSLGDGKIDEYDSGWKVFYKIGNDELLFPLKEGLMLSYGGLYSYSDRKTDANKVNNLIDKATDTLNEMSFVEYAERDGEGRSRWKYFENNDGFICGFEIQGVVENSGDSWRILCASEAWKDEDDEKLAIELANAYSRYFEDDLIQITDIVGNDKTAIISVMGRYYSFYRESVDSEWNYAYEGGDGAGPICSSFSSDEAKDVFSDAWSQCR